MTSQAHVLLIGCGAMGGALLRGWNKTGYYSVTVIDPLAEKALRSLNEIDPSYQPNIIVFAVKPQVMAEVVPAYRCFLPLNPLFVSIAAGTSIQTIQQLLTGTPRIIRAMPNLPATVGEGMTGLVSSTILPDQQRQLMENLFCSVGKTIWIQEESLMDVVTAVSGSGPAYFFYLVECLTKSGMELGLSEEEATQLARQTLIGAAEILKQSTESAEEWRRKVTSPGGTTAAALQAFEDQEFLKIVWTAAKAAVVRAKELSQG
jgi:pyrroline-5-carboxylate reductase